MWQYAVNWCYIPTFFAFIFAGTRLATSKLIFSHALQLPKLHFQSHVSCGAERLQVAGGSAHISNIFCYVMSYYVMAATLGLIEQAVGLFDPPTPNSFPFPLEVGPLKYR